jgi:hypothetical protein
MTSEVPPGKRISQDYQEASLSEHVPKGRKPFFIPSDFLHPAASASGRFNHNGVGPGCTLVTWKRKNKLVLRNPAS